MYLFSIGSGSTDCLGHHSKWEDPAIGINLSTESDVGFSSENSDIWTSRSIMYDGSFCYVQIMPVDASKKY